MVAVSRSLLDVLRLSTGYLGDHGSGTPRLDAELLIAHALEIRRLDVYLQFERPLDDPDLGRIRELVRRRGRGEPVAYLVGEREFFGRAFLVSPAVLIPRPETETLVGRALAVARARGGAVRIADIGTGSGCIACSLAAELPSASVIATDISREALLQAGINARRLGVSDRVELAGGSWAEPVPAEIDIIVSNPPYVSSAELGGLARDVADFEPRLALDGGDDGLACYRDMFPALADRCAAAAWIGLEVDSSRAGAVAELAALTWPRATVTITDDLSGRPRVVEIAPPERKSR